MPSLNTMGTCFLGLRTKRAGGIRRSSTIISAWRKQLTTFSFCTPRASRHESVPASPPPPSCTPWGLAQTV